MWANILDFYNQTSIYNHTNRESEKYFSIFENYPNPFNKQTVISYYLKKKGQVKLRIYDIIGREVITLANTIQQSGLHKFNWNGQNKHGGDVPSSVYFYSLMVQPIGKKLQIC